jgi:tetratricopeptide (TPR) repeat protein
LLLAAGALLVAGAVWIRSSDWGYARLLRRSSIPQLEAAVHRHPEDTRARYDLAKGYYLAGRFREAGDAYREVIAREPRSARAHLGLGLSLFELADLPAAAEALERALSLDQRLAWAEYMLGKIAWLHGSVTDALPHVRRATELDPRSGPAWYGLGVCYLHLRRYEEAIPALRQAIVREDRNAQYHTALAEVLLYRGGTEEGRQQLERALQLNPQHGPACALMGNYYLRKAGGPDALLRAAALLEQAARLPTYHPEQVYLDLGDLYLQKGEFQKARDALNESIRLDPRDERPYFTLSRVYRRLGQGKQAALAEARFRQVSRLHVEMQTVEARVFHNPGDQAARLRLARVYRELGLDAKAAAQYARYLHDRPKDQAVSAEFRQWLSKRGEARSPGGRDFAPPALR